MPDRPLCFVVMPSGRRSDGAGTEVDFDAVWRDVVGPAIEGAGLEAVRDGQGPGGGVVHRPVLERLVLCDYAVVDLTTAGPEVFYELGVRHAARPNTTVMLAGGGGRLPFDLPGGDGVLAYGLDAGGRPADPDTAREALRARLDAARAAPAGADSPVFQMVDGLSPPDIARLKTDVFRHRVEYSADLKQRLAAAREDGIEAVRAVETELGDLDGADPAVVVDLLLSYRALGTADGWQAMVDLVGRMPPPLEASAMVQEQLGLALNRLGRRSEAAEVLAALVARRGPSSETCAILGRVHKDRWAEAQQAGDADEAREHLDRAIAAYLSGFEADWRDAFPGLNAVTLMEIRDPPDPRRSDLVPVVRYAAARRLASGRADYWDHATRMELAVLGRDEAAARAALGRLLDSVRETWEPHSTANNLAIIRRAREARGEADPWAEEIERTLLAHGG